jgi:hypothetical protein
VDLSAFLEKQRTRAGIDDADELHITGEASPNRPTGVRSGSGGANINYDGQNEGEIDYDLERMMRSVQMGGSKKNARILPLHQKNNKQVLPWDQEMEAMQREKRAAEAMRGISFTQPFRSFIFPYHWFFMRALAIHIIDLKTRLQGSQKIKQARIPTAVLVHGKGMFERLLDRSTLILVMAIEASRP